MGISRISAVEKLLVQGFTYTIDRKVGGVTVLQGRRIGRNLGKGRNLSHRMDTNDNSSYMRFSVTSDMPELPWHSCHVITGHCR